MLSLFLVFIIHFKISFCIRLSVLIHLEISLVFYMFWTFHFWIRYYIFYDKLLYFTFLCLFCINLSFLCSFVTIFHFHKFLYLSLTSEAFAWTSARRREKKSDFSSKLSVTETEDDERKIEEISNTHVKHTFAKYVFFLFFSLKQTHIHTYFLSKKCIQTHTQAYTRINA